LRLDFVSVFTWNLLSLDPIDRASLCLRTPATAPISAGGHGLTLSAGPNWVGSTKRWEQKPVSDTGRWIMFRIVIVTLIYHRHRPIDSINLYGLWWKLNVFPERYWQTYRVEFYWKTKRWIMPRIVIVIFNNTPIHISMGVDLIAEPWILII
jgi:hypothetical protein